MYFQENTRLFYEGNLDLKILNLLLQAIMLSKLE